MHIYFANVLHCSRAPIALCVASALAPESAIKTKVWGNIWREKVGLPGMGRWGRIQTFAEIKDVYLCRRLNRSIFAGDSTSKGKMSL